MPGCAGKVILPGGSTRRKAHLAELDRVTARIGVVLWFAGVGVSVSTGVGSAARSGTGSVINNPSRVPAKTSLLTHLKIFRHTMSILIGSQFTATFSVPAVSARWKWICFAVAGMWCSRIAFFRKGMSSVGTHSSVIIPADGAAHTQGKVSG